MRAKSGEISHAEHVRSVLKSPIRAIARSDAVCSSHYGTTKLLRKMTRHFSYKKVTSILFRIVKSSFYDENPIALVKNHLIFCRSNNQVKRIFGVNAFLPNYRYFQKTINPKFTPMLRRNVIVFHQHIIQKYLKYNILKNNSVIWHEEFDEHTCAVTLSISSNNYLESELELSLKLNGTKIYYLSFMISRGISFGINESIVIFIGRVQGVANQKDKIRLFTRLCHGFAPIMILLTIIQALAVNVKAQSLCGLKALDHPYANNPGMIMNYDKMWQDMGSSCENGEYHIVTLPIVQKPLSDIVLQHRRRARKRREFKDRVAGIVTAALA